MGQVHRGVVEGDEEAKHDLTVNVRKLDVYLDQVKKNTEFFSDITPDLLLGEIKALLEEAGHTVILDPKKYKLTVVPKAEESTDD